MQQPGEQPWPGPHVGWGGYQRCGFLGRAALQFAYTAARQLCRDRKEDRARPTAQEGARSETEQKQLGWHGTVGGGHRHHPWGAAPAPLWGPTAHSSSSGPRGAGAGAQLPFSDSSLSIRAVREQSFGETSEQGHAGAWRMLPPGLGASSLPPCSHGDVEKAARGRGKVLVGLVGAWLLSLGWRVGCQGAAWVPLGRPAWGRAAAHLAAAAMRGGTGFAAVRRPGSPGPGFSQLSQRGRGSGAILFNGDMRGSSRGCVPHHEFCPLACCWLHTRARCSLPTSRTARFCPQVRAILVTSVLFKNSQRNVA